MFTIRAEYQTFGGRCRRNPPLPLPSTTTRRLLSSIAIYATRLLFMLKMSASTMPIIFRIRMAIHDYTRFILVLDAIRHMVAIRAKDRFIGTYAAKSGERVAIHDRE